MSDTKQQQFLTQLFKKYSGNEDHQPQQSADSQALESLKQAADCLQKDNRLLRDEFYAATTRLEQQHESIIQRQLLDLIDLYDRLHAAMSALEQYKPVKSLFKNSRKKDINFIKRIQQGQRMSLSRLEQLLYSYQLRPIGCIGKQFNPETMHAIATASKPKLKTGMVLEELQRGFLYQDKVLRLAEVKVNKIKKDTDHE